MPCDAGAAGPGRAAAPPCGPLRHALSLRYCPSAFSGPQRLNNSELEPGGWKIRTWDQPVIGHSPGVVVRVPCPRSRTVVSRRQEVGQAAGTSSSLCSRPRAYYQLADTVCFCGCCDLLSTASFSPSRGDIGYLAPRYLPATSSKHLDRPEIWKPGQRARPLFPNCQPRSGKKRTRSRRLLKREPPFAASRGISTSNENPRKRMSTCRAQRALTMSGSNAPSLKMGRLSSPTPTNTCR